jgi:hypothetical protein
VVKEQQHKCCPDLMATAATLHVACRPCVSEPEMKRVIVRRGYLRDQQWSVLRIMLRSTADSGGSKEDYQACL